jgi:hypothetical protein
MRAGNLRGYGLRFQRPRPARRLTGRGRPSNLIPPGLTRPRPF